MIPSQLTEKRTMCVQILELPKYSKGTSSNTFWYYLGTGCQQAKNEPPGANFAMFVPSSPERSKRPSWKPFCPYLVPGRPNYNNLNSLKANLHHAVQIVKMSLAGRFLAMFGPRPKQFPRVVPAAEKSQQRASIDRRIKINMGGLCKG